MGTRARRARHTRRFAATLMVVLVAATGVVAASPAHAAKLDKVTIGYSAWPGWFPLAVADKAGIFKKNGLDVDLKYFGDYIASLDAMVAGKLDANAQTLNDTMAAVAGGSKQADHRGGRQLVRQRRDHLRQVDHVGGRHEGQDDRGRGRRGRPLPPPARARQSGHDAGRHRLPRCAHRRRGDARSRAASSTASACSPRSRSKRSSVRARTWCSARRTSRAPSRTTSWCRRTWWRSSRRWRRSS